MPGPDWIDVSVPLDEQVVVWPGDPRYELRPIATVAEDGVEVSQVRMSVHTGTHVDAPAHYNPAGARIGAMPLDTLVGPCTVLQIPADVVRIEAAHLERLDIKEGERVLLRTRSSQRRLLQEPSFVEDYSYLAPQAAQLLARRHVRCVGIDYLSIGGPGDEGADTHKILLGSGIWVIEGLELSGVEPGAYQLVCLPLRMMDAEGAPARAILRALGGRQEDEIRFIDDAVEWATKTG